MAAIRSKGNKATELKLISIFRANGVTGWRRGQKIPGNPDFVFHRERLAIFVDGCFWHGCRWHCRMPKSNENYWTLKIRRNKLRDTQVARSLRRQGWFILRIWEHSLKKPTLVIQRVQACLDSCG